MKSTIKGTVETILQSVPIDKSDTGTLLARFFSQAEARHYRSRGAGSIAGGVAAKKALARIARIAVPGCVVGPGDFSLTHTRSGAPRVRAFPACVPLSVRNRIRISISHTRTTAYAMATLDNG